MTLFVRFLAALSSVLLLGVIIFGFGMNGLGLKLSSHWLFALCSGLLAVSQHCLIFGIFTGSGKEGRECVQDHGLVSEFIAKSKVFKRTIFPPATYSIFLIVGTTCVGGALASFEGQWLRYLHQGMAWITLFYHTKTGYLEALAVDENCRLLSALNEGVTEHLRQVGTPREVGSDLEPTVTYDWGSHVIALGKFIVFLSYNIWLPFLYFRFVMGYDGLSLWPFFISSSILFVFGTYLKLRYSSYSGH